MKLKVKQQENVALILKIKTYKLQNNTGQKWTSLGKIQKKTVVHSETYKVIK